MRTIRLLAAGFLLAASSLLAIAQADAPGASVMRLANGPANVAGLLYAANFAHWTASPTDMGNHWTNAAQCYGNSGGLTFPLFGTGQPITIVDNGNPAYTETVTASLATYNSSGCSVSLPATHPHINYYLKSGTAGLWEAINWVDLAPAVIVLTPDWTALGGTTAMITSAAPFANTTILDQRTSLPVAYSGSTPSISPIVIGSSLTNGTAGVAIVGVTGGGAAASGNVGQVIQSQISQASAVTLTTSGTTYVVASVSLTAGDWDVQASGNFLGTSITTLANGPFELSINSGTGCSTPAQVTTGQEAYVSSPVLTAASANFGGAVTTQQANISATTTYCLVATGTFSAGTLKADGSIVARRRR